jgi:hypothetical protein
MPLDEDPPSTRRRAHRDEWRRSGNDLHAQERRHPEWRLLPTFGTVVALVLVGLCVRYTAYQYGRVFSDQPVLTRMAYEQRRQLDFHHAINGLARTLRSGIEQEFTFEGVVYQAKYIPGRDYDCFWDIKPKTLAPLTDELASLAFKAPTENCADGPLTYNAVDAQRVGAPPHQWDNTNPRVVYPPPGLGTPQEMPDTTRTVALPPRPPSPPRRPSQLVASNYRAAAAPQRADATPAISCWSSASAGTPGRSPPRC